MPSSLKTNFVYVLVRQLVGIALGVILVALLARILTPEGNGRYALAMLIPTTLVTLLNMGVAPAVTFAVARGNLDVASGLKYVFRRWVSIVTIGLLVGAVATFLLLDTLYRSLSPAVLAVALLAFVPMLLQAFLFGIIQGLEAFKAYGQITVFSSLVNIAMSTTLALTLQDRVLGAITGFAVSQTLTTLALLAYLYRKQATVCMAAGIAGAPSESVSTGQYGLVAHISNVATFVNYRLDIYIVTSLLGSAAAGLYVAAVQVGERLWLISTSASSVLLPRLASSYRKGPGDVSLVARAALAVLGVTAALALAVWALGREIVSLLFGTEYAQSLAPLLALLPGIVFGSYSKVASNDLAARGLPIANMVVAFVLVGTNIAFNLLLLPRYGLVGAAAATSLSYVVDVVIKVAILSRLSGRPLLDLVVPFRPPLRGFWGTP